MYDYVRPQKLLDVLKANNPLYADIDVNEQWIEDAMTNDEELCRYLVEQDDDSMDTECRQLENDGSVLSNGGEGEPMVCTNGDEFSIALQQQRALAHQNSFHS